jgi:hypothetical protein
MTENAKGGTETADASKGKAAGATLTMVGSRGMSSGPEASTRTLGRRDVSGCVRKLWRVTPSDHEAYRIPHQDLTFMFVLKTHQDIGVAGS